MGVLEVKKLIGDGFTHPTCVLYVSNTSFKLKITLERFCNRNFKEVFYAKNMCLTCVGHMWGM